MQSPLRNSASAHDKEPPELDALLKWQKERRERRLRGEYESAVLHLSQVINDNLKTPMNVSAVRVEGAPHTRRSFLSSIVTPFITPAPEENPSTLEDVLHTTRHLSSALQKTGIFSSVEAYLDTPRDTTASSGDVDLVFKTKERGKWYLSSSTELGNAEGTASAQARIRNVFGGAETFEANLSFGTKTRRAFRASLNAPLTSDMDTSGEMSAYGMDKDLSTYASCTESLRGVRAVVRRGTPSRGSNELAYDAVIRHIASLTPTASLSTREAAGASIKSSLSHTLLYDTRDDRISATSGVFAKLYQEFAGVGLGGDAHFYKTEAESQISRKLGNTGVAVSFAAKAGVLWSLAPGGRTLFSDRFQLGGPTSVRSFRANSMGPRDRDDSVGGELHYSAGASVISDIPSKPHWPVKAHLWINAGRLDNINQTVPLKSTVLESLSKPSISAGVGLIYRFDPVRVEVNFGMPLAASKSDGTRKGIQVGIGLDFL